MYGVIYKRTFPSKKCYIGQTIRNPQTRWNEENSAAFDRNNSQQKLSNAIIKYGVENIENEIIDKAFTKKELNDKETYWIDYYNSFENGYNMTRGGEGGLAGEENPKYRHDLDNEEIKQLYVEEGLPTSEIAELLDANHNIISRRLKSMGIEVKDDRIHDDIDDEEIRRLYVEEEKTTTEIADLFGVSSGTISRRLKNINIEIKSNKIREDIDDEELKYLIEENKTLEEISKMFNCSVSLVKIALKS